MSVLIGRVSSAVAVTAIAVAAVPVATAHADTNPGSACARLYVVGVPGTGETSSGGSTDLNSGMLGSIVRPLSSLAGSLVADVAVPYDAGFGGAVKGGDLPYSASVTQGVDRLATTVHDISHRCGDSTQIALAGFSQGAQVVSMLAKKIGTGQGPIPAAKVAGVAVLGDPARKPATPTFAGGGDRPAPADSATAANDSAIAKLPAYTAPTAQGGGIGPTADIDNSYGDLDGRVGDFCAPGDLACDAPSNSPIVHIVTNLAGQSELKQSDPVGSLTSIATALGSTVVKAGTTIVNEDVSGQSLDEISYAPGESISQRLATASDPRTPLPSIPDVVSAATKLGMIGFNAVKTVATTVFTPDTIAKAAAVGLANPAAALGVFAAKLPEVAVKLVPPSTVSRLTDEAFAAVQREVTSNADLLNVSNLVSYWNAGQTHNSYAAASSASSPSATLYIAQWFSALAHDLAGQHSFSPYRQDGVLNFDTAPMQGSPYTPSVPPAPTESTTPPSFSLRDGETSRDGSRFDPFAGGGPDYTPAPASSPPPSSSADSQPDH